MQNAVTHAEAKRIVIDLERAHDRLILRVEDDGRGMSGRLPSGRGIGLDIMRFRAQALGAELTIGSASGGRGTAVCCTVPLGITA